MKWHFLELSTNCSVVERDSSSHCGLQDDGLHEDKENLMIKLKFLKYKLHTFLIRNRLPTLFKHERCPAVYKDECLSQMKSWGISPEKKSELSKMLDKWAEHILEKYENADSLKDSNLKEAEHFLQEYANQSSENKSLVGPAGYLFRIEDCVVKKRDNKDEEGVQRLQIDEAIPTYIYNPSLEKNKKKNNCARQ